MELNNLSNILQQFMLLTIKLANVHVCVTIGFDQIESDCLTLMSDSLSIYRLIYISCF